MNKIINKILLAEDKFMPEMHLRQPDLRIVLVIYSLKIEKESKILKKQEIQDIFIEKN